MSKKRATTDDLSALHAKLAAQLAKKIAAGDATAADMAVARQFLKDNNITAIPTAANPLGDLAGQLPFADEDAIAAEDDTRH